MGVLHDLVDRMLVKKPHFDNNDNLKILQELTDHLKQNSYSSLELETKYKSIISHSLETLVITKTNGLIIYISSNCDRLFGYKPDELLLRPFNIVHPDDISKVITYLQQASSGIIGKNCKYRIVMKDGTIKNILHSWSPLYVNKDVYIIANLFCEDSCSEVVQ